MGLSSMRLMEEQLTSECDTWPHFGVRGHLDPGRAGGKALRICHISKASDDSSGAHVPHLDMLSSCQKLRHCRAAM